MLLEKESSLLLATITWATYVVREREQPSVSYPLYAAYRTGVQSVLLHSLGGGEVHYQHWAGLCAWGGGGVWGAR